LSIKIGENENLTATLNGTENDEIAWSIEDDEVATLSSTTGSSVIITAVAKGTTKITATYGEYSTECTVTSIEEVTYGNTTLNYYVTINDDSAGVVAMGSSPVNCTYELQDNIIYADTNSDGVADMQGTKDEKEDSNGDINKILCLGAEITEPYWNNTENEEFKDMEVSYYQTILTTNGSVGFERVKDGTYYYLHNGARREYTFVNGKLTEYADSSGSLDLTKAEFIVYNNVIYISPQGYENLYMPYFIIFSDDTYEVGNMGS